MTGCLFCDINESAGDDRNTIEPGSLSGGIVKPFMYSIAVWVMIMFVYASSVQSQTQEIGGYTVMRAGSGSIVCLGRWVPSKEPGRPGLCDGQMVDGSQLTAIATKQTADKLDQLLIILESIDQKLADNNSQIERLIEATVNTQASINQTQTSISQQTAQVGELMNDTISTRVDALSKRVLANETFRKELEKLKQDILTDVKKYYTAP